MTSYLSWWSVSGESKVTSNKFQVVLPKLTVKSPVTALTGALDSTHTSSPGLVVTVIAWPEVSVLR